MGCVQVSPNPHPNPNPYPNHLLLTTHYLLLTLTAHYLLLTTHDSVPFRSAKGSSSAHAINTDRLSEVILEDRKRERLQEAAREKGGWDVGQRPKAAMTYLEYPLHTRTEVTAPHAFEPLSLDLPNAQF